MRNGKSPHYNFGFVSISFWFFQFSFIYFETLFLCLHILLCLPNKFSFLPLWCKLYKYLSVHVLKSALFIIKPHHLSNRYFRRMYFFLLFYLLFTCVFILIVYLFYTICQILLFCVLQKTVWQPLPFNWSTSSIYT